MKKHEGLDANRVEMLLVDILMAIQENYKLGPTHRERVYEALNALATAAALTIYGCGDQAEALEWFSDALNGSLKEANEADPAAND